MEFEYDPAKSASNKAKHGIDFEEAQRLWDAPTLKATTYAGNDDERSLHVGVINGVHWTAITTERNGKLCIVSVRHSRDYEKEAMMSRSQVKAATGEAIDEAFDNGEDMRHYFDFTSAKIEQPAASNEQNEQRPMSLNLPSWLIAAMDAEAARRGTTRASVAKNWLVDRADQERERRGRLAG